MEDFYSHRMKVWDSAEICSQHPAAWEKRFYPLLVIIPALPTCIVKQTGPKSTVSGKVFPLLNEHAIDLLSLIKLSGYFSLHNLDKKMTIPPRLRKKLSEPSSLFGVSLSLSCCLICNAELSVLTFKAVPHHTSKFLSCLPSRWQTLLNFGTEQPQRLLLGFAVINLQHKFSL